MERSQAVGLKPRSPLGGRAKAHSLLLSSSHSLQLKPHLAHMPSLLVAPEHLRRDDLFTGPPTRLCAP